MLAIELQELIDANFDRDVAGFSVAAIDLTLDAAKAASPATSDKGDVMSPVAANAGSQYGDL